MIARLDAAAALFLLLCLILSNILLLFLVVLTGFIGRWKSRTSVVYLLFERNTHFPQLWITFHIRFLLAMFVQFNIHTECNNNCLYWNTGQGTMCVCFALPHVRSNLSTSGIKKSKLFTYGKKSFQVATDSHSTFCFFCWRSLFPFPAPEL